MRGPIGALAEQDHGTVGAIETLDVSTKDIHRLVLGAATCTLSVTGLASSPTPTLFRCVLVQDATGGRLVTWWAGIYWKAGVAPTLSVAANAIDQVDFLYDSINGVYIGTVPGTVTGPQGADGLPGLDGLPGFGLQGPPGIDGLDGVRGLKGDTGATGITGSPSTFIGARCESSAGQTIGSNAWTGLSFTAAEETRDTDGFHEGTIAPSRFTIPATKDGLYSVGGSVAFTSAVNNARGIAVRKNGGSFYGMNNFDPNTGIGEQYGATATILDLVAGDYVEVVVYQLSGGNLGIAAGLYGKQAWLYRIAA